MTPQEAFAQTFPNGQPGHRYGVAVSGGGDSMALLVLARDWAVQTGVSLYAATVDHGLRPDAAEEAQQVATFCKDAGIPHTTLTWDGWTGDGNLQSAARSARYALLSAWANTHDLMCVMLGHTQDDQAETVLLNLARGSGIDGLASMPGVFERNVTFVRPLLQVRRAALRALLQDRGITWIEDPSNDDQAFSRVKVRQMSAHLAELGLTPERLAHTASHMARAQNSLWAQAQTFAAKHVQTDGPDLLCDEAALMLGRSDTEGRVLAAALQWIGGQEYRPRFKALNDAVSAVLRGQARTLSGCVMLPENGGARLFRERANAKPLSLRQPYQGHVVWDHRWSIEGPMHKGSYVVKALGEAIHDVPNWREIALPRQSLMATPAVFEGDTLIAAPVAGLTNGWKAHIVADFFSTLHGH